MKTKLALLLALLFPLAIRAADAPTSAALQKGLFEEEANQNLDAAIKAYQSVLAAHDDERKLAATALFRLGECYRKLGQTNEAIAQYQRLLRDYSEQTILVTLSQQNLAGLGALADSASQGARFGQDIEQIRLLKQELATQQAEASKDGALFDQLFKLSRSELRNVLPTAAPDVLLSRLLEELSVAQQKHSEVLFRQSPDHPEAKAALKRITVLFDQIDERIDGIKKGWRIRMDARARNIDELHKRLAALTVARPAGKPSEAVAAAKDSASRTQLKELLQGELKIAEEFLAEQRKKIAVGTLAKGNEVRFEREVLGLKRQLVAVDGLSSAEDRQQWRELLVQEIKLAEEAARLEKEKLDRGMSIASEVALLQRDVLILKRELLAFDAK
jgi:tetratricopeptide (TPR) repeat protein